MHRPGAAIRQQRELARVEAAGDGNLVHRSRHLGHAQEQDGRGGRRDVPPERSGQTGERPPRRVRIDAQRPAQLLPRPQPAEHHIGVGDRWPGAAMAVASFSTSRKPAVVTKPVRAPRRSSRALVATVVPCTSNCNAPGATPARSSAASTARSGADRSDSTLTARVDASAVSYTIRSVKVPPTSMPTNTLTIGHRPAGRCGTCRQTRRRRRHPPATGRPPPSKRAVPDRLRPPAPAGRSLGSKISIAGTRC